MDGTKAGAAVHDARVARTQPAGTHEVAERLSARADRRRIGRRQRPLQRRQAAVAQVPRHLSAGRPRPAPVSGPARAGRAEARVYSFMVRTAFPGGRLRSDQLLAELDLCDEVGNGTLRITSRQSLQIYGVAKRDLVRTLRRLNEAGLTTLGACGDAAPQRRCVARRRIAATRSTARSRGWPATWPRSCGPARPRIGKSGWAEAPGRRRRQRATATTTATMSIRSTARAICRGSSRWPSACRATIASICYAQDVGLMALCENFQVAGYNVLVGGGMGSTPRLEKTFPALAQRMASSPARAGARRGAGDPLGLPRLRQSLRSPPGAIEVPRGRLGTGGVQGPGRGPVGICPGPAPGRGRLGHRRPRGLARAGRRPVVLRPARRRGADCRLRRVAAEIGAAGNLPQAPAADRPDARPRHSLLRRAAGGPGRHRRPVAPARRQARRRTLATSAAGRGPAWPCPPVPGPSPRASGCCPACSTRWKSTWPIWAWPASGSPST